MTLLECMSMGQVSWQPSVCDVCAVKRSEIWRIWPLSLPPSGSSACACTVPESGLSWDRFVLQLAAAEWCGSGTAGLQGHVIVSPHDWPRGEALAALISLIWRWDAPVKGGRALEKQKDHVVREDCYDVDCVGAAMGTPSDASPVDKVVHGFVSSPASEEEAAAAGALLPKGDTMTVLLEEEPEEVEGLPGPSGLQTPKGATSRPSPSLLKPKRAKKQPELGDAASGGKRHVCLLCQKAFQSAGKLAAHQVAIHGTTGSSSSIISNISNVSLNLMGSSSGSIMSSSSSSSSSLPGSIMAPFKCEHCCKSFSSKFKLVRHVLIHSDRKPFSCTVCERTFHRKDHLKNHIKVHSPSKQVYVCDKPDCGKEYTSALSYRKHAALHAAEEGGLDCKMCAKSFETKAEILFHLKIHAGSRTVKNPDEKKFTCELCDRRFFTRKDVRRHLVVHTGMRDFLCQFCPQRFGRKDHLVRHIKKSHSKLTTNTTANTTTTANTANTAASTPSATTSANTTATSEDLELEMEEAKPNLDLIKMEFTEEQEDDDENNGEKDEEIAAMDHHHQQDLLTGISAEELIQLPENEDILRLIEDGAEDATLPLPGFSQAFHSNQQQPQQQ